MKMKTLPASSASVAAAILAGGLLFSGPANAAVIFSEDFEELGNNAFGVPTYAYVANYTMPNGLTPPGGLLYGMSGHGPDGQPYTNQFELPALSLTLGTGVSAGQIDAGLASYDFRAQFSTWTSQGDYAELSLTFKDAGDLTIGDVVFLGGDLFTAALASGQFGSYADARAWGESAMQGIIPAGARTLEVVLSGTKTPGGTAIDGYVDNISLAIVPEPATIALLGFASLVCCQRRRR